jgi:hypothetical protein
VHSDNCVSRGKTVLPPLWFCIADANKLLAASVFADKLEDEVYKGIMHFCVLFVCVLSKASAARSTCQLTPATLASCASSAETLHCCSMLSFNPLMASAGIW